MKKLMVAAVATFAAASAFASDTTTTPTANLGLDFAMPYTLRAAGNSVNTRGNMNIGIDGRYWLSENLNVGSRVAMDIETRAGSERAFAIAPGVQYRWLTQEAFNPYVRADVPVTLNGAAGTGGADIGMSGGLGLAWNLGQSVGLENLLLRYDFNVGYNFGVGDSINTLGIEFFKLGMEYRF